MTWFKVDDQFSEHKKVRRLGKDKLAAIGLWTLCGNWSAATLSDGFVPGEIVQRYDPEEKLAESLVRVGLWEHAELDDEAGYQFHDWDDHQPSKADVEARRKADADRRARWREAKQGKSPESESRQESRRDTTRDTTRDTQPESRPVSSLPDPTRPGPARPEESLRDSSSSGSSNRGTSPAPVPAIKRLTAEQLSATAQRPAAFALVSEWRSTHEPPYQRGTYDAIAQHVDAMLAKDADLDAVRDALRMWDERGDAKPGLLPHLYDDALHMRRANTGYDRLFANGVPVVPVEEIPDEYFTRARLDELLGEDTNKPLGPFEIEFEATPEERKAWYDEAGAKRLTERIVEARSFLDGLKRKAGSAA